MVCQQWEPIARRLAGTILVLNIVVGIVVVICVAVKHQSQTVLLQERHSKAIAFRDSLKEQYQQVNSEKENSPQASPLVDDVKPGLEFLSLLKPIAVFSGLDFEDMPKENPTVAATVRNWVNTDSADRKLLYNGMQYSDGAITVPASGLYRVYSHVKFFVRHDHGGGDHLTTFRHEIRHYSAVDGSDSVLFGSGVTECRDGLYSNVDLEYPSDIGGLVRLGAGDALSVKVSNFTTLSNDQDWHYFGMYLV